MLYVVNLKAGYLLLTEKGILFVLKSIDLVGDFIQESWRVHFVLSSFFGRHVQLDSHGFHELFNFSQSELDQLIPLRVGRPEKKIEKLKYLLRLIKRNYA